MTHSRVWDEETQDALVNQTAKTLVDWGLGKSFRNIDMLRAFRVAMVQVLPEDQRRPIPSFRHISWAKEPVELAIDNPQQPTLTPATETESVQTDLHLILDTLTSIEDRQQDLSKQIERLTECLVSITQSIIHLTEVVSPSKPKPEPSPVPVPRAARSPQVVSEPPSKPEPPKPLRIVVAGLLGDQQASVRAAIGPMLASMNLEFIDPQVKTVGQIQQFDWLIMTDWVGRVWKQRAISMHPTKAIDAHRSVNGVVNAIQKVARCIYERAVAP